MSVRTAIAGLAALGLVAACAPAHPTVHTAPTVASGLPGGSRAFRAVLHAQGTTVTGAADMRPGQQRGTTVATINVQGGASGTSYGWAIHVGSCGSAGDPIAEAQSYPPIEIHTGGIGSAQATLPLDPPGGGNYHVEVHGAPDLSSPVVACGELEKVGV